MCVCDTNPAKDRWFSGYFFVVYKMKANVTVKKGAENQSCCRVPVHQSSYFVFEILQQRNALETRAVNGLV